LALEHNVKREEVLATWKLHVAQIQSMDDVGRRALKVTSSIEQLNNERVLELIQIRAEQIFSEAQEKANRIKNARKSLEKRLLIALTCPHCRKKIGFNKEAAGKTRACPNPECRRGINVPLLFPEEHTRSGWPSTTKTDTKGIK
jgi:uncharacterized protein YbaR (Trm112 family)